MGKICHNSGVGDRIDPCKAYTLELDYVSFFSADPRFTESVETALRGQEPAFHIAGFRQPLNDWRLFLPRLFQ